MAGLMGGAWCNVRDHVDGPHACPPNPRCPTCRGCGYVPGEPWNATLASTRPNYRRRQVPCPDCKRNRENEPSVATPP